jgi:peptidoglycan lytic transglycosylase
MSSIASCPERIDGSSSTPSAHYCRVVIAFIYCVIVFLTAVSWSGGEKSYVVSINTTMPSDLDSNMVIVSIPNAGFPGTNHAELELSDVTVAPLDQYGSIITGSTARLRRRASPLPNHALMLHPAAPAPGQKFLRAMENGLAGGRRSATSAFTFGRDNAASKFVATYRSMLKLLAIMELPRILQDAALTQAMLVGTASVYDPNDGGKDSGGFQTASGEPYDRTAWTAAIQIDLREQFGGVRYGKLYRPTYALVTSGSKQLIVKINDVGPLRPNRVIDLNERSMQFFDPFMQRGLIPDIKVTRLPGEDWTPGPVGGEQPINFTIAYARELPPVQHDEQQTTPKLLADRTYDVHGDIDADDPVQTCQGTGACVSPVALHLSANHGRSRSRKPSL